MQSFATIAPYTIEEAYEVADAIARDDMDALADELGDLQLQVVFHARMAEEAGHFTLDDVIPASATRWSAAIRTSSATPQEGGHHFWEVIKAEERASHEDKSALAGVALALPALERAAKLQRRAARTGFDWPDVRAPRQDRRGTGRAGGRDRAPAQARGDGRPAVRGRQPRTTSEHRTGSGSIESEPGFEDLDLEEKEALWAAAKLRDRSEAKSD